ncbi:MAG: hypothetical protein JXA25_15750 [Anaerolineales bacterium]|nr:hypothetical protein [Anaerolineales bacterium]
MKVQEWLPVVLSVLIIVLVAVIEKQSKAIAAVTATMPLTIPLAIWIVYSSSRGDQGEVTGFTFNLFLSILPTVTFVIAAWLAARNGARLGGILLSGYLTWGVSVGLLFTARRLLSLP